LSIGLSHEYRNKNIDVLSVNPGFTKTPLESALPKSAVILEIEAIECSEASLKQLGQTNDTYGHWKHAVTPLAFTCMKLWAIGKGYIAKYSKSQGKK